ncbi:MAG TPA: Mov34/MPN/PAD-1 family protein [Pyrinomonadaceae bacterium]|nr:Mov34/MPN/PAD-1 family protein [Pyrinomonadaceae bacterium]
MREETGSQRESGGAGPRVRVVTPRPAAEDVSPELPPASGGDFATVFARAMTLHKCQGEERRPGDCEVAVLQSAYQRVVEHLSADTSREHGGLLLGYELRAQGRPPTVVVTHSLPAKHTRGTPTSLTFTTETWEDFERQTDQLGDLGLQRVGWYHSHPNLSVFLSGHDLDVCTNFPRPTHVALVVDPVKDNGGFFVRGAGREGFRPHSPQGFIELHDRSEISVVTWRNMTPLALSVPAEGLGETLSPAERGVAPEDDPGRKTIHIHPARKTGYTVPYWAMYASTAAGVCLMGGLALASVIASQARRQVALLEQVMAVRTEEAGREGGRRDDPPQAVSPGPATTQAPEPEPEPPLATPPTEVAGAGAEPRGQDTARGGTDARRDGPRADAEVRKPGAAGASAVRQPGQPKQQDNSALSAPPNTQGDAAVKTGDGEAKQDTTDADKKNKDNKAAKDGKDADENKPPQATKPKGDETGKPRNPPDPLFKGSLGEQKPD